MKLSPSYELLVLVSEYLDPKTLAIASCICKSWFQSLSSDFIWEPICTKDFPSITHFSLTGPTTVSYHRLYAIGYAANKRRFRTPPKPKLSVEDLVFSINIFNTKSQKNMVCMVKPVKELVYDPNGVFKFEFSVKEDLLKEEDKQCGIKIVWNVILNGWRGVFTMMDCEGKVVQEWFSDELPLPGCSSSIVGGCILADFKLGVCSRNFERVISLGIMSSVSWRYLTMDDGLRYLQYFLISS